MKNAELPSNLEIISDSAFRHCVSLENIEIPDSVSVLEDETFAFCEKLKSVSIGSKLKSIDYRTFYECPALEKSQSVRIISIFHQKTALCTTRVKLRL